MCVDTDQKPTDVKVIISFGAIYGGFELAWDLRNRIQEKLGKNTAYIDAISLEHEAETKYTWDQTLGIFKMSNPKWNEFYEKAMHNSQYMIFIITKPWLNSFYCYHEYMMFRRLKAEYPIKPIFIIFPDAEEMINTKNHITLKKPKTENKITVEQYDMNLGELATYIDNCSNFPVTRNSAPGYVKVDRQEYHYEYKYALDDSDTKRILSLIK